jgi:hypothetical protein
MAQPMSTQPGVLPPVRRATSAIAIGAAMAGAAVVCAALALWFHYGTTVFFDMIASGFAGCF